MMNIELSIPEDLFVQFITNKLAKVSDKHRLWLPIAHVGISKEMRRNGFELHQIVNDFPCELCIIFLFSESKNFTNGT